MIQNLFRLMQESDVDSVTQIENLVQSHPWTRKQFEDSVSAYQSTVYEENGQVVGFCILQPVLDEANLLLMAVHPSQQGKRIGYKLLDNPSDYLKMTPCRYF